MSPDNDTASALEQSESAQESQEVVKPRVTISNQDKKILKESLIRFTSCGRCSLFLAAYRLNHDDAELLAAVNNINHGWLTLPWDQHIRKLIIKSFGCRIDVESYYFESCCPECHNPFTYAQPENSGDYIFRIKV